MDFQAAHCGCTVGWNCVFSAILPNPVTAAAHKMGNPIMTQLCDEIKTHVGCEEESYLSELKGGRGCCCAFTGEQGIVLNVHLPAPLRLGRSNKAAATSGNPGQNISVFKGLAYKGSYFWFNN